MPTDVLLHPCPECEADVPVRQIGHNRYDVTCTCGYFGTLSPNRPDELGQMAGRELARLADAAAAAEPNARERCSSCAFRGGTIPNGCSDTIVDAVECIVTGHAFLCHMTDPMEPCAGWLLAMGKGA